VLYLVEESQTQVFRGRPHDPANAIPAWIAHDRRFLFEIEQAGLTGESVGGMEPPVLDHEVHGLKRFVLGFRRETDDDVAVHRDPEIEAIFRDPPDALLLDTLLHE